MKGTEDEMCIKDKDCITIWDNLSNAMKMIFVDEIDYIMVKRHIFRRKNNGIIIKLKSGDLVHNDCDIDVFCLKYLSNYDDKYIEIKYD